ncbi:MAG: hypothetical protein MK212_21390, partial [Saprospiraceae bacterium]|nr:hypothetical protein [Saprospiraceae bacterium]
MLNKKIVYFVAIVTSVALHGFGFKDLIEQAAKDLEAGLEEVARELESPSIERNQSQRQASPISTNNKGGKYSSRKTPSLEEQANAGDPNAQFSYALKQSKPSEMIKFLTLSADQGYAPALNKLGELYLEGAFLDYNTSFAEGKFLEAFEQGNAVAAYNLSLLYSDEDHQMLNEADAAKFLKEAAKLGLADAQAELGKSLIEDNRDAGLRWLELASNAGSEEASYTIAIYYDGQEDDVQAYKYFSKTKNSEIADAHYYLGKYLLYGWGVQVDEKSAYFHAQKGADLGSKLALNLKAECLEDGIGVESDPEEAFKIFATLAGEGMDIATYNLARCYKNGIGVEADQTLATKYYIDASELGYPYAHIYTGERLLIGNGIKKDFVKAKYYLEKARSVEDDLEYNMYAASLLGNIYLFGKGVEVDLEKAYELYLSSESTARNSRYHLGWMYEKGIYVDADIDNAINYYKRDDAYPRPANRLGEIYSKGIGGTTINMSDARAYYATAADTVYPNSKTESANAQLFLARAFYHDSIWDMTAQEAY